MFQVKANLLLARDAIAPRKQLNNCQDLLNDIEKRGSADTEQFGFPRHDGLFSQQDTEEYASFIEFMARKQTKAEPGLDIGVAFGGQSKFLRDDWECKCSIFVDIGQHADFEQWPRISQLIDTHIQLEIIDDFHSPRVREMLLPYAGKVDFAFVCGDHSYNGLRKDIFLIKDVLFHGGLMGLHNTTAAGDVKSVYDELLFSRDFVLLPNFSAHLGIYAWKRTNIQRNPSTFNKWSGCGRI